MAADHEEFHRAKSRGEFEEANVPLVKNKKKAAKAAVRQSLYHGVVSYPDPLLRQKARTVEEGAFGTKMLDAEGWRMLEESNRLKAAGLAHCQIGGHLKLVTIPRRTRVENGEKTMELWCVANLELIKVGPMVKGGEEGCLSLAGVIDQAEAPSWVEARFQLLDGTHVEERIDGYAARVYAHEWAHLHGELLCDRIKPPWRKIFLRHVQKKLKAGDQ